MDKWLRRKKWRESTEGHKGWKGKYCLGDDQFCEQYFQKHTVEDREEDIWLENSLSSTEVLHCNVLSLKK